MSGKPVSVWKIISLTLLFTLVLTSFRLVWIAYHEEPDHPDAEEGDIDLTDWHFTDDETITLDGAWQFYPDTLLSPDGGLPDHQAAQSINIKVPRSFNSVVGKSGSKTEAYGYGTYTLTVKLPDDPKGLYGIRLDKVHTAANVYVDGQLVMTHGKVGTDPEAANGKRGPTAGYFQPEGPTAEVMIQVSNYGHPLEGGLIDSVQIGNEYAISKMDSSSRTLQLVVAMIFFLHCLYAVILYFMGKSFYQRELLFFGLMLALHGFTILIDDDIVLQLPVSYIIFGKLTLLLFISTIMTLTTFIKTLFRNNPKTFRYLKGYFAVLFLLTVVMPFSLFNVLFLGLSIFYIWAILTAFKMIIQEIRRGNSEAVFLLFFMISYTSNLLWGVLINVNLVQFPFYPFDFLVAVFVIALILFHRQIRLFKQNQVYTEKLQEQDKRKDEFLANTSHELRNPLHSIINIAYVVAEQNEHILEEKDQENLNMIIRVGEHMRFTLNDLLDSSKLKDNEIKLNEEAIHLQTILAGVTEMVHFNARGKDIEFQLNTTDDFPPLHADRNRVIQILFNLLHNAVKFTDAGTITIHAEEQDGMASITVEDTGRGMSKEEKEKIFQPYEQFHDEISAYEGGTGLGLSISKQLVELHGGNITIQSEKGRGTAITFTLPLADREADTQATERNLLPVHQESAATEPAVENNHKHPDILIVDDDPMNLQVLSNLLYQDYNIQTVQSGHDALELVNKGTWDLIILDVMMPNMSGYELTETIRKQYSIAELPILLLTARAQKEDIYTGFDSGANDYLVKPVTALELKARVHTLTTLKQSVHEQLKFEAAWLQAQIRPHFLFNTLNTIASVGVKDTDKMITLMNEFGNYLHKSFANYNTDAVIPMKNELELLHSYLYIEQTRFQKKMMVKWKLETVDFKLPPLSIQPIIENALRHGILKKPEGGTITIWTTEQEDHYQIEIIDDGVGMDEATIDQLLRPDAQQDSTRGVGISNINRRLIKVYGKGLEIESSPGRGTTVRISIPKVEND